MNTALIALSCAVSAWAADYTTYIGDANEYRVTALATDANGNTYITGGRLLAGGSVTDVFVSKVDNVGNVTLLATLRGNGSDVGNAIAVDPAGNIFVAGTSSSTDFPLLHPLQSVASQVATGFLVKFSPNGAVVLSTYLGGTTGRSGLYGVATDSKGDVYVTGNTEAPDYPRTPGLPAGSVFGKTRSTLRAVSGGFFAKISSAGDKIIYAGAVTGSAGVCLPSTCLTDLATSGTAIAVDSTGGAYIAGNVFGFGLPTTPGAFRTDGTGGFVMKVNPVGTGLAYLTMLGAARTREGYAANNISAVAVDSSGSAYIGGSTADPAFPVTPGAVQTTRSPPPSIVFSTTYDAFAAKLNPAGTTMVWATFLGGNNQARNIALDPKANVWVSGTTNAEGFADSPSYSGSSGFLAELSATGSARPYSARFPDNYVATALAMDAMGALHHAGANGLISVVTPSVIPNQSPPPRMFGIANSWGGVLSGRIAPGELISIYGANFGPAVPTSAHVDANGFLPTSLAGIQVNIDGIAAPLLYVSDTQINAVTPIKLPVGISALRLVQNGTALPDLRLAVDPAVPQLLRGSTGRVKVINQDGTVNADGYPAKPGSYVSVWVTGVGYTAGPDGYVPSSVLPYNYPCSVFPSGRVSYAGTPPGMVSGILQVNFQVSTDSIYSLVCDNGFTSPFLSVPLFTR